MNTFLLYFLQVNIAIALFYLFYRLFFVRDTFWSIRRHYLLLSILISFVHPLLSVESWLGKPEPMQQLIVKSVVLPEFVVTPDHSASVMQILSVEHLIGLLYGLVALALFVRMLLQLVSILQIRVKGKTQVLEGVSVIALDKEITPFSFFGWVFLNPELHTEEEIRQILIHEQAHARQYHSLDVLVSELLAIVFWCNPAVWLLKREIRQNLEYLADNKVLQSGFDSKTYQYHLLQLSYQTPDLNLTNKFNISPLKKRITMMNQKKSNKAGLLKYSLVVPLALALVLSSNAQEIVNKAKKVVSQQDEKVNPLKLDSTEMFAKEELESARKAGKSMNEATGFTNSLDNKIQVYFKADKMPQYPGGDKALINFLAKNTKFPMEACNVTDPGRVVVRFTVNEIGKITNVKVLSGQLGREEIFHKHNEKESLASKELQAMEREACRVVKAMPNWIPGQVKGKNVAVIYALPIVFKLKESNTSEIIPSEGVVKSSIKVSSAVKMVTVSKKNQKTLDGQDVYETVEKMPQFPGGNQALMNYISQNLKYPVEAQKNGVQGKVVVRFIVNSLGKVEQAEVAEMDAEDAKGVVVMAIKDVEKAKEEAGARVKPQVHLLEQEALRVVKTMPVWTPGEENGKKVAVWYALPIKFRLE